MWLAYAAAWISTSAAVIAGIYLTGSAWCLWALFIPAMIRVTHKDASDDKAEDKNEMVD